MENPENTRPDLDTMCWRKWILCPAGKHKLMGWEVRGLYDINPESAKRLAEQFNVGPAVETLDQLLALNTDGIFDLAVPGRQVAQVLAQLPRNSFVLIQKPLGETLDQAKEIVSICEERGLSAAVNFQLRWAPYILALKDVVGQGLIGEVDDISVQVNVHTPWAQWTFLEHAPRMEMVYHSIHYVDLIRHILGEPDRVQANSIKDPRSPKLESSRSAIYLDYGVWKRATINTFHGHMAGPRHQESYIKVEGSKGAVKAQMGLNMDYPKGMPDYLHYWIEGMDDWVDVPLEGSWFPHAFRGPMADMMRWHAGGSPPSTEVHDALKTMNLVDVAYRSSDQRGLTVI